MVFIFEWNSTASTPSPRSTRLAPDLSSQRPRLLAPPQQLPIGPGRRQCRLAEPVAARVEQFGDDRRRLNVPTRRQHLTYADGVPDFEGPQSPSRSPTASRGRRRRSSRRCRARRGPRRTAASRASRAGTRPPCPDRGTAFGFARRRRRSRVPHRATADAADCLARYVIVAGSSVRISEPCDVFSRL